jgi:hypothetical protein
MIDRHWLGDLGLAVLLALPFAALAQPLPAGKDAHAAEMASLASNDALQAHGRIGLLG